MEPSWLELTARIAINGVNPYVTISADQAGQLKSGWRKSLPVLVQANVQPDEL